MLSSKTGVDYVINRYEESTAYSLGMKIISCSVEKVGEITSEAGTSTRQVDQSSSNFHWSINFRGKLQRLSDYITSYCMITAEGDLPINNLYIDDGNTTRGFTGCQVNRCTVKAQQTGSIIADVTVYAIAEEDKTLTETSRTEYPMTKQAVTTLTVDGDPKTKWVSFDFGVTNNVQVESTGTSLAATEIYAKEATYEGNIDIVNTGTLMFGYGVTTSAVPVVITLTDNQTVPEVITFTFALAKCRSNKVGVEELGLVKESLQWEAASLVIS